MMRRSLLVAAVLFFAALIQARAQRPAAAQPTHKDLAFATVGGQPLKLDLYLPKDSSKPAPVLVHIHGGGWRQGSKDNMPPYCLALRDLGWAVAGVQYRLTSQAGQWGDAPVVFPAQINDVKGAVRWLRANAKKYNLDPDRFAAWGESAGGHLTALLAASGGVKELEGDIGGNLEFSSAVQAGVDYFGPTDLEKIGEDAGRPADAAPRAGANPALAMLVGFNPPAGVELTLGKILNDENSPYKECVRRLRMANPIQYVGPKTPPIFIGHGSADPLVPINQSRRLEDALKKAGVKVQMVVTDGAGHGGLSAESHLAGMKFLCEVLDPGSVDKIASVKLPAGALKKAKKN